MTLAHRRFLVTRPANQSAQLARLLREAGAEPLLAPMIVINDPASPAELDAVLTRLGDYDLAVFVSPSALDEVGRRVSAWPPELAVAVVGPASRERAVELGMLEVISPGERFDSEGLLAHPALQKLEGKRVVLFRGNGGRELLADTLVSRGAQLDVVEAYRRQPPAITTDQLSALIEPGCDGVIITSSEAAENLFSLADAALAEQLRGLRFFVSHPAVAEAVQRLGADAVTLTEVGDVGILAGLNAAFAGSPALPDPEPVVAPPAPSATTGVPSPASAAPAVARAPSATPPARSMVRGRWALLGLLAATGLVAAMLYYQKHALEQTLERRLAQIENRQQSLSASDARDGGRMSQLDARLASIDHQLEEARARLDDLQTLYGTIAGDQEEALLADAELTLSLASQQLQLTGNVGASLAALYRLDERLAGQEKPRLAPLRRALARDIDVLKRFPWVDYVGLSARLDSLAVGVDKLPLVIDANAPEDIAARAERKQAGFWEELGRSLGALVEIRRLDQPDPVLLPPQQALYLRENLKLRLLNARLALLQRDDQTFQRDLAAAENELRKHFNTRSRPVLAALASLKSLRAAQPAQVLPSLNDSLNAVRDARRKVSREEPK
ncbi:fused uroporphyrinogen-III synthase HemD/membrane protein HemX [Chitinimonas sp. BJYL2]|uniref:fused uroporphyrinogen-III synthase HemD/membrane protein HemX n=1 Tax=Chitinimonas sp. BJYL2 TaxID=2976696 RepID=UPI0022B3DA2B|nr:fused uroporphyrinogen-III synthase HemD/membrane protein HemX [Chitinimonas sp. BJYL2]